MSEPAAEPLLPVGYYADNFALVLDTVADRYSDILSDEEKSFIETWRSQPLPARRLYVRMISRKGPVLRRDRLKYGEIPNIQLVLDDLVEADLADNAPDVEAAELLPLLMRGELHDLAAGFHDEGIIQSFPPKPARKDELVAISADVEESVLREGIEYFLNPIRPLGLDHVLVFRLLFFGNLYQDLTEFVLRDIGMVSFEPYPLDRELRLFPNREDLDQNLALRLYRQEIGTLLLDKELDAAVELAKEVLQQEWLNSVQRHLDRVANAVGRDLERAGRDDEALTFYETATRPPARERRARVLERTNRNEEALSLCYEIEDGPQDETEAAFAPRFVHKLHRKLGEKVAAPKRPTRPTKTLTVYPREDVAIETLALEELAADGQEGFFAENWLWKSLFGLAFWDIVFAPLPGVFQHPFQYGPLDLSTPGFRPVRQTMIEERLTELRQKPWSTTTKALLARWDEKYGTANALVAWGEELRPRVALALSVLDGQRLAAVCDRLSRDLRRYRRGLPDLFVLREEAPGFELLEVKGPGDQLRPEQGAWIDELNAHGLPTAILKVSYASS